VDQLLSPAAARVFFDGLRTDPRLDHPEGIALHPLDGSLWCGGGGGQLFRISPDGSGISTRAERPGGFVLGVAISATGDVVWLDALRREVLCLPADGGDVRVLCGPATPGVQLHYPNAALFLPDGSLLVTDSHAGPGVPADRPGPGVLRVAVDGDVSVWSGEDYDFANGIALAPGADAVFVAESAAHRISRVPIRPDGSAGARETWVDGLEEVPDGLAVGPDGALYVACYYPARLLRVGAGRDVEVLYDDPRGHVLANPTNLVFRGSELLVANLGRWHVTSVDLAELLEGAPS